MDGIIMVTFYNTQKEGGYDRFACIARTCQIQLRPVVMTCVVAMVGLLPAAVSTGIGSQVQRPLALVVVGGITLAPLLFLTVLPVLMDIFSAKSDAEPQNGASAQIAE
jgi:cobalt-zinc-cadmium resistance protein CzcA